MFFLYVHLFDDDPVVFPVNLRDFSGFALVLSGDDDDGVVELEFHMEEERKDRKEGILHDFGSEGNDLLVAFFAELTSDGTEDTSAFRIAVFVDDDDSIVVEADGRAVFAANGSGRPDDDCGLDGFSFDGTPGRG